MFNLFLQQLLQTEPEENYSTFFVGTDYSFLRVSSARCRPTCQRLQSVLAGWAVSLAG